MYWSFRPASKHLGLTQKFVPVVLLKRLCPCKHSICLNLLKIIEIFNRATKNLKSVFMIFHIDILLFFHSQVFLPVCKQDFKIFLNLSEMHISEAEKLAARMTRGNRSVYFLLYKCYLIFPQSKQAFALLILSVFFAVLQSESLVHVVRN